MSQGAGKNGVSAAAAKALRAETSEDEEMFERLFRLVLRSFYDDKMVVVAEQVFRWTMLPADVLAGRLGLATKDVAVLAHRLVEDKVLCHFKRSEKKEGVESRMFPRSYFYMHPPLFLGMLKYRLHHLRLKLDSSIVSSTYTTSFICPQCKFTYSTLDVAHLLDFSTNTLRCERPGCGEELKEDEEEGEETRKGKARMRKFNEQCSAIIRGLETLEGVRVSSIDPAEFLAQPANHKWRSLRAEKPDPTSSIPHEDRGGDYSSLPDAKYTRMSDETSAAPSISLTDATTSAAALRAARDEADRQRKENAIPEWLSKSTVSGQETALGIKDRQAREAHEQRSGGGGGSATSASTGTGAAAVKGEADGEDDYYAAYARMQQEEEEAERARRQQQQQQQQQQAASAASSSATTTATTSAADTPTAKRSRSVDVGEDGQENKKVKREGDGNDDGEDEEEDEEFEEVA